MTGEPRDHAGDGHAAGADQERAAGPVGHRPVGRRADDAARRLRPARPDQPAEHPDPDGDRDRRRDRRDRRRRERVAEGGEEADDPEQREADRGEAHLAAGQDPEAGADGQRDDHDDDLERQLVVGAEQADHHVLGPRRLEVDDELADAGDQRARAREQAGQELGDAERGGGGRDAAHGGAGGGRHRSASVAAACDGSMSPPGRRRAHARPSRCSTTSGSPNARLMVSLVRTASQRPGGHDPARREHERVGEPGRDLLEVVRDEDDRRGSWCRREPGEVREQRLARAEVEAGRGLVEEQEVRVRHQGPGDRDPPALAGGQRPVRLVRGRPDAQVREERPGAGTVRVAVLVPPRLGRRVAGGHHDVDGGEVVAQDGLDGTPRRADPAPQLAAVHLAVARPEDLHGPGRRPQRHADHRQERGLARAVRPDHHPALAGADGPVERPEDGPPGAPDHEVRDGDDLLHAPDASRPPARAYAAGGGGAGGSGRRRRRRRRGSPASAWASVSASARGSASARAWASAPPTGPASATAAGRTPGRARPTDPASAPRATGSRRSHPASAAGYRTGSGSGSARSPAPVTRAPHDRPYGMERRVVEVRGPGPLRPPAVPGPFSARRIQSRSAFIQLS